MTATADLDTDQLREFLASLDVDPLWLMNATLDLVADVNVSETPDVVLAGGGPPAAADGSGRRDLCRVGLRRACSGPTAANSPANPPTTTSHARVPHPTDQANLPMSTLENLAVRGPHVIRTAP